MKTYPVQSAKLVVPLELQNSINKILQNFGLSLLDSVNLARSVQKNSDFYLENPEGQTPWREDWAQVAQLCYYLPLNYLRLSSVVAEANRLNFFEGLTEFIDFGSGLGAASLNIERFFKFGFCIEHESTAQNLHQKLQNKKNISWSNAVSKIINGNQTMGVFSYSLTELGHLPRWAYECEAILIVEPSTQQDGRRLSEFRQGLIEKGYSIWAPCLHQKQCPLLIHSKKDWCHHRIHWERPDWFLGMEKHLPIKNNTLTYSYLLARRKPAAQSAMKARVIGDMLVEKGKTRVLICRGEDREYLSWLKKDKLDLNFSRGDIVEVPSNATVKGNEIRLISN